MPRRKNLDLAGELGEDVDVTEAEATTAAQMVAPVAPVVVPPAPIALSGPVSLTREDLAAMITAAVEASAKGNAALADAVTQGIQNAREPIPENKFSPNISNLNPLGERAHPRPGLKCEMAYGVQDARTKRVYDTYPLLAMDLTAAEQVALNTLEPTSAVIERLDGAAMKVSVVPEWDPITDALAKLTIVVPTEITAKGSQYKNMLPGVLHVVKQLTGRDYATLPLEDLGYLMAEHRAKRFVSGRETVAA